MARLELEDFEQFAADRNSTPLVKQTLLDDTTIEESDPQTILFNN